MDESDLERMGPIDYVVVEFPMATADFSGRMASELKTLVDGGLVRVLDLLFIQKGADGSVDAFEASDFDDARLGALREVVIGGSQVLAEEDVDAITQALEPDTLAAVLVWEDTWAAPFAMAVRESGGQLAAQGRIPVQGMLAAIEAQETVGATKGV